MTNLVTLPHDPPTTFVDANRLDFDELSQQLLVLDLPARSLEDFVLAHRLTASYRWDSTVIVLEIIDLALKRIEGALSGDDSAPAVTCQRIHKRLRNRIGARLDRLVLNSLPQDDA